jgi:uncharacterized protein YktB (UPF0637 family)
MKEAIQRISTVAEGELEISKILRAKGDHINATRHEKLAKNLHKIAKAARLIFLP